MDTSRLKESLSSLVSSTKDKESYTPAMTAEQRREEMRRVREQQQEIARQKALEAEKKRKEKEAAEKKRRNEVALSDAKSAKASDVPPPNEYNPMQPWSGTSRGYRYVR